LLAVIQSAYVEGVSTRKVDDLVQTLGLTGIDKSKVSRICKELDEAVTAFRHRPLEVAYPYSRVYSTNPLERVSREVKRRTNVAGIFPNSDAVLRLVGSVLIEVHEEWQAGRRHFSLESMRKLCEPVEERLTLPSPLRLAPIR
jgi:transposase-like protein